MRELLIRYESETGSGAHVRGSVAMTGRSRRALTMTEHLVEVTSPESPRTIATARSIHVTVDRGAGRPVEVPEELLAAVEKLQGRPVPQIER